MEHFDIVKHIQKRQKEKEGLLWTLEKIESLPINEATLKEVKSVISDKVAQCDISIRDHEELLKQ